MLDCCKHKGNVHTRVILLPVKVHNATSEVVGTEHRERLECLVAAHHVRPAHVLAAGYQVVQECACIVVGNEPP